MGRRNTREGAEAGGVLKMQEARDMGKAGLRKEYGKVCDEKRSPKGSTTIQS